MRAAQQRKKNHVFVENNVYKSKNRDMEICDTQKSSRNKHNIFGYVANSAIKIVMDKYKLRIMRYGKGNGFTFK